jgi:hypothetical protein
VCERGVVGERSEVRATLGRCGRRCRVAPAISHRQADTVHSALVGPARLFPFEPCQLFPSVSPKPGLELLPADLVLLLLLAAQGLSTP